MVLTRTDSKNIDQHEADKAAEKAKEKANVAAKLKAKLDARAAARRKGPTYTQLEAADIADVPGRSSGTFRSAKYAEIPEMIAGEKRKRQEAEEEERKKGAEFFVDDTSSGSVLSPEYTPEQTAALGRAQQAYDSDDDDRMDAFSGARVKKRPKWEDRRNAIMAYVGGGIGTIYVAQRGDAGVAQWVLKAKNKQGKSRFRFLSASKHIGPKDKWPTSNKFWLYMNRVAHEAVVRKMREHPELADWKIRDLGNVPMDFVADDRKIYFHLVRQDAKGKIDIDMETASDYFSPKREIHDLRKWVTQQQPVFEPKDIEW